MVVLLALLTSAACATCHPQQAELHQAGMHVRALKPASSSQFFHLIDRPVRERNGSVEFTYSGATVQARRGQQTATLSLPWVFGAGTLAFTPVGLLEGRWIEHRVSWYSASQRPGMTLGHPVREPASAASALGQTLQPATAYACFHCHATGVKPGPDLSAMQPGIHCQRCHGSGEQHLAEPSRSNVRSLTGLSAKASVAVCAECHRTPADEDNKAPEIHDPVSIRFAPVGLMASRCFQASGKLTCVTCHDPHGGQRPASGAYEQKCRSCHATSVTTPASQCPREASCLACHMRKATPVPDLTFTDHRIRIYRNVKN